MNESYWIDEVQKLENKVDELEEKLRVSDKLDELVWCECNRRLVYFRRDDEINRDIFWCHKCGALTLVDYDEKSKIIASKTHTPQRLSERFNWKCCLYPLMQNNLNQGEGARMNNA